MTIQPTIDAHGYPTLSPAQEDHARALLDKLTGIDWTCLSTREIVARFKPVLGYVSDLIAENLFDTETCKLHDELTAIYLTAYSCAHDLPEPTDSEELPF
jgi:hypothetical protein